jgi:hypothetical protein
MTPAQLVIATDLAEGQTLGQYGRAVAAQEERKARTRLASLAKARRARVRAAARREAENARQWRAWSAWCREDAAAWSELRAAEAAELPARIDAARKRLRRVTTQAPAMPAGAKPIRNEDR